MKTKMAKFKFYLMIFFLYLMIFSLKLLSYHVPELGYTPVDLGAENTTNWSFSFCGNTPLNWAETLGSLSLVRFLLKKELTSIRKTGMVKQH